MIPVVHLYLHGKVLPLVEESHVSEDKLFTMDEIKIEVMRSRGAGGQVCLFLVERTTPLMRVFSQARQQNGVCCSSDTLAHRHHGVHAR